MNLVCVASAVLSLVSLVAAEVVSLSGKNFDQVCCRVMARLTVRRSWAAACP